MASLVGPAVTRIFFPFKSLGARAHGVFQLRLGIFLPLYHIQADICRRTDDLDVIMLRTLSYPEGFHFHTSACSWQARSSDRCRLASGQRLRLRSRGPASDYIGRGRGYQKTSAVFASDTCSTLNSKFRSKVSTRHLWPVSVSSKGNGIDKIHSIFVIAHGRLLPCLPGRWPGLRSYRRQCP